MIYARVLLLVLPGKTLEGCNLPDGIGTRFAMRRAISYIRMCKRYKLPATRMYSDVVTIIKNTNSLSYSLSGTNHSAPLAAEAFGAATISTNIKASS
jgi:hypothetical protein